MERVRTHNEIYRDFLRFIQMEAELDQRSVRRRMLTVIVWCFILPAVLYIVCGILVLKGFLPFRARFYYDWLPLLFPVSYSIFVLGREVIGDVPRAFRRGPAASVLDQALAESEWRERVADKMRRTLALSDAEWAWVEKTFALDLKILRYRAQFLTLFAGAVFFLIVEGFEAIGGTAPRFAAFTPAQLVHWFDAATNSLWQLVGLFFFLVMFYLASSQTQNVLERYLNCVRIIRLSLSEKTSKESAA